MSKKLTIGILSTMVGLGVAGGVCYNTVPAFKISINNILKNNDNKASISFDNPGNDNNDDGSIIPIKPGEFLRKYKYELPTSFLGGDMYVKVLSNNNLLVSSSIASGILLCDAQTESATIAFSTYSNWKYFHELDSGNYLISSTDDSSGLVLYNITTNTIEPVFGDYQGYTQIQKSPTGKYILFSAGKALVSYDEDTNSSELLVNNNYLYKFIVLENGNIVYSLSGSTYPGVYLKDISTGSNPRIHSGSSRCTLISLGNNNCLISGPSSSYPGLYLYTSEDNTVTQLLDTDYNYHLYSCKLSDEIVFIGGYSSGIYSFNISDNTLTQISDSGYRFNTFVPLNNGDWIIYSSDAYQFYIFNHEDNSFTLIPSAITGTIYTSELSNGDVIITCKYRANYTTNWKGIYLYSDSNKTLSQLYGLDYYWDVLQPLSNGNCLIGSTSSTNLLLYNATDGTVEILLKGITTSSIEEQSDGTYLIKTNDFDYEYDCDSDTIKLVYTVE